MKKKQIATLAIGVTLLLGLSVIGYIGYRILNDVVGVFLSDNESDNNSPEARKEMAKTSCEWGRLACFPTTKQEFIIKTEGNAFTRSFRGSFSDTPETIQKWLLDSAGVQDGTSEVLPDSSTKYNLKMGGGALFGEVIVSEDTKCVSFYIVWS